MFAVIAIAFILSSILAIRRRDRLHGRSAIVSVLVVFASFFLAGWFQGARSLDPLAQLFGFMTAAVICVWTLPYCLVAGFNVLARSADSAKASERSDSRSDSR